MRLIEISIILAQITPSEADGWAQVLTKPTGVIVALIVAVAALTLALVYVYTKKEQMALRHEKNLKECGDTRSELVQETISALRALESIMEKMHLSGPLTRTVVKNTSDEIRRGIERIERRLDDDKV